MIFQTLGLALFVASVAAQTACNGFDQLCTRLYSNVTFAAAHNAAFVGRLPSHNQLQYPEVGMDLGIRYFTTQVHLHKDNIQQCHSDCALLNVGPFSEMVVSIKKWLDNHPREVVTLLVTNGADSIPVDRFATVFKNAGAENMVYSPSRRLNMDQWPTLGEMISSGKRFVVFMDYHADTSKVPYILPQYDYYVETPFSPTDKNFYNCDIDRPSKGATTDNRMLFVNHNLNDEIFGAVIPDRLHAKNTNSVANIRQQTEICTAKYRRTPNVVMLDFVSEGEVIQAQKLLNGR